MPPATETAALRYGLVGSLTVHFFVFVLGSLWIGGMSNARTVRFPLPPAEPEPEETLIFPEDVMPEKDEEEQRYIRTTQNAEAPEAPQKTNFISDRNTVASAKLVPEKDGDPALPSTRGVDAPTMELMERKYQDGKSGSDAGAPAPPAAAPPSVPTPLLAMKSESAAEAMMKELDTQLSLQLQGRQNMEPSPADTLPREGDQPLSAPSILPPPPMPSAPPVPPAPRPADPAFQPETLTSETKGSISNIGPMDAVAAAATPVGRYMRQVTSAVEQKWHFFRRRESDAVEPGRLSLRFFVNKHGKVEDLRFTMKAANPLMEDFTIEAILKADIPPIPPDLLPILDRERLEVNYDIVIHP